MRCSDKCLRIILSNTLRGWMDQRVPNRYIYLQIVYPHQSFQLNWSSLQYWYLLTKCLHDQEQRWPSVIIQLVAGTTGPLDAGPETRNLAAPPHHHRCIFIPTLDIYRVQRQALILMIKQIRRCRIFICSCLSPSSQISSSLSQKSLPQKHLHSHHYQLCPTSVM